MIEVEEETMEKEGMTLEEMTEEEIEEVVKIAQINALIVLRLDIGLMSARSLKDKEITILEMKLSALNVRGKDIRLWTVKKEEIPDLVIETRKEEEIHLTATKIEEEKEEMLEIPGVQVVNHDQIEIFIKLEVRIDSIESYLCLYNDYNYHYFQSFRFQ